MEFSGHFHPIFWNFGLVHPFSRSKKGQAPEKSSTNIHQKPQRPDLHDVGRQAEAGPVEAHVEVAVAVEVVRTWHPGDAGIDGNFPKKWEKWGEHDGAKWI